MDHELKQRLIGAVFITALAAIFVPMLFDDPVDNSGQQISELAIPKAPENVAQTAEKKLPEDFGRALTGPDQDNTASVGNTANPPIEATEPVAQAEETPPDDELVVTEAEAPTETLDTGEVVGVVKPSKPKHVAAKPKPAEVVTHVTAEPKAKSKHKDEAVTKTIAKAEEEDIVVDAAPPKPKTTSKKTSTGSGHWSIQAGSFSKKENAVALLEKLQKQGFPVILQSKGDIYRIKIGPELDKQRASDMKKRLDKQNIQSLMIAE